MIWRHYLDSRTTPAAAANSIGGVLANAEGEPDPHDSGSKPDNSRKKAESLSCLPSATRLVPSKVPGPDAAAGQAADGVDEDTEGSEPSKRNEYVHRPGEESRRERDQPYEA